jgi:sugar-specific transcriptional regulator TrmB
MEIPYDHISTLTDLGLSLSQAKVYLALAESKNLTAQVISKSSGVARPDVYRILNELEKDGLVEKIITKPEKFKAISAEECVASLIQRRIEKTHQLQEKAFRLVEILKEVTPREDPDDKHGFILISGRDAVYSKMEKMIKSAQEQICFLGLTRRILAWLPTATPSLHEALARKVNCRMIMPKPEKDIWEPLKRLEKNPYFGLRLISEQPTTSYSIWDQKEILLITSPIDSATPAPMLWSNNKSIVNLGHEHFESLWRKTKKINIDSKTNNATKD